MTKSGLKGALENGPCACRGETSRAFLIALSIGAIIGYAVSPELDIGACFAVAIVSTIVAFALRLYCLKRIREIETSEMDNPMRADDGSIVFVPTNVDREREQGAALVEGGESTSMDIECGQGKALVLGAESV